MELENNVVEKAENQEEKSGGKIEKSNGENEQQEGSRIEKLINDAVKRETNKITVENKKLTEKLEKLQKEKLSDDEIKKLELDGKIAEIEEREKRLAENENRLHAIKAIKTAGLDDGSENSLELIDFVMSNTKDEINNKVKTFGELINKFVKAAVDKTFKGHGRVPNKGGAEGKNNSENNIVTKLGKAAAEADKKSRSILNSYLGR